MYNRLLWELASKDNLFIMKTLRLLSYLLVIALSVGFVSCSDDGDDKDEISIVGKWKSTDNDVLEFESNGTFMYYYDDGDNDEGGKWKIESGKLYMMWLENDEPDWTMCEIHVLDSISLIIEEYYNGKLDGYRMSFQRIK